MMRALIKRLAHYSRIDTPTIVSFVLFLMDPEPRTTLHVNFSELRQREGRRINLPRTRTNSVGCSQDVHGKDDTSTEGVISR
jgi:hypothetical protein